MYRLSWPWSLAASVVGLSLVLGFPHGVAARTFWCSAGAVPCLIDAIKTANANGQANTIYVGAGTYPLTGADNTTEGPNGLPAITSYLTIQGAGADITSLERPDTAPSFRLLYVAATGTLTLQQLTLRGGGAGEGGGIANRGNLSLTHCRVVSNDANGGGGINNAGGTVTITDSTLRDNVADGGGGLLNWKGRVTILQSTLINNAAIHEGGGFANYDGSVTVAHSTIAGSESHGPAGLFNLSGTVTITDSAIIDNGGDRLNGAGLQNHGFMTILNSTIARNFGGIWAGINNGGQLFIANSTIVDNFDTGISAEDGANGGGIGTFGTGSAVLQNTILARNGPKPDCRGPVTSLGTNLIGDPTGCTITLQASDRTGDPGLGTFTDNGSPGQGHLPLLPTSQAIDAGDDAACSPWDQLGQKRQSPCDIGAIEFYRAPSPPPPVALVGTVQGDFNGDGAQDQAGITVAGAVWIGLAGQPWRAIPGYLTTLVAGDVDGDGRDELVGLSWGGSIWVLHDAQTWQWIPGTLTTLVVGDFYGDGQAHLAGLSGNWMWRSPRLGQWEWVPGWLTTLVVGDFDGDGRDDFAGLSWGNSIWLMRNGSTWEWIPGSLLTLRADPAAGQDDLVGWNGACWYRMHTVGVWQQVGCGSAPDGLTLAATER